MAPTARTVFEYDPDADPASVRYLPAPYNELTCPERFSLLPSKDAETLPFPEASVDLLVHERRPEIVPPAIAEKLASCPSPSSGQLDPIAYTMRFDVYVTNDGQAVSGYIEQSTLGDRQTETCMVNALRTTLWPADATSVKAASVQTGALKTFLAQPAPAVPPPDFADRPSGIYSKQSPASDPKGIRVPRIFVIPLGPIAAAGAVFGIIYFWSSDDAPAWRDELNPITRQPYTSLQEYDQIRRLSPQEILERQRAQMTNTQPQAPPASTPTAPPVAQRRRHPGQTCDDSVLDELEKQKRDLCYTEEWTCSNEFEKIGKKKEKLLTCPELLPRVARGQACLNARLRVQAECYAGSPESKHDDQIEAIRRGVKWCVDKAAVRGPGGGPCQ